MSYAELDKGWRPEAPPLQGRGLGWGLSAEQIRWLQERAHEMRRNPTEPEKRLWRNLSNSQVDGLTLTGKQQIEVLTQAARDAGMNEAAAQRTELEAAILCNGNPDCLR